MTSATDLQHDPGTLAAQHRLARVRCRGRSATSRKLTPAARTATRTPPGAQRAGGLGGGDQGQVSRVRSPEATSSRQVRASAGAAAPGPVAAGEARGATAGPVAQRELRFVRWPAPRGSAARSPGRSQSQSTSTEPVRVLRLGASAADRRRPRQRPGPAGRAPGRPATARPGQHDQPGGGELTRRRSRPARWRAPGGWPSATASAVPVPAGAGPADQGTGTGTAAPPATASSGQMSGYAVDRLAGVRAEGRPVRCRAAPAGHRSPSARPQAASSRAGTGCPRRPPPTGVARRRPAGGRDASLGDGGTGRRSATATMIAHRPVDGVSRTRSAAAPEACRVHPVTRRRAVSVGRPPAPSGPPSPAACRAASSSAGCSRTGGVGSVRLGRARPRRTPRRRAARRRSAPGRRRRTRAPRRPAPGRAPSTGLAARHRPAATSSSPSRRRSRSAAVEPAGGVQGPPRPAPARRRAANAPGPDSGRPRRRQRPGRHSNGAIGRQQQRRQDRELVDHLRPEHPRRPADHVQEGGPASTICPRTAWSASHGCVRSDSRPVSSTPSSAGRPARPRAADDRPRQAGSWTSPPHAGQPVPAVLEGVGGQVDRGACRQRRTTTGQSTGTPRDVQPRRARPAPRSIVAGRGAAWRHSRRRPSSVHSAGPSAVSTPSGPSSRNVPDALGVPALGSRRRTGRARGRGAPSTRASAVSPASTSRAGHVGDDRQIGGAA